MNQYVTGAVIKELREKAHMTQAELAEKLFVSDKAVSKWENGKGCPDISLLDPIAAVFGISIAELLSGRTVSNANGSADMLRSRFYVCPACGNVLHSTGEAVVYCHGMQLLPEQAEESDERHKIFIEGTEDEYYVRIEHDMTKTHYISFIAALSQDRLQLVRLYPEGNAEARFQIRDVRQILFFCIRDGLFSIRVHRAIDAKPAAYDQTDERRALEQATKMLLG